MNKLVNMDEDSRKSLEKIYNEFTEEEKINYVGISRNNIINYIIKNFIFDKNLYLSTLKKQDKVYINFYRKRGHK